MWSRPSSRQRAAGVVARHSPGGSSLSVGGRHSDSAGQPMTTSPATMPSSSTQTGHALTAGRRRRALGGRRRSVELDHTQRRHPAARRPGRSIATTGHEAHDQHAPPRRGGPSLGVDGDDLGRAGSDVGDDERTGGQPPAVDRQLPRRLQVVEPAEPAAVVHPHRALADQLHGHRLGECRQLGQQRVRLAVRRHQPVAHEVAVVLGSPKSPP